MLALAALGASSPSFATTLVDRSLFAEDRLVGPVYLFAEGGYTHTDSYLGVDLDRVISMHELSDGDSYSAGAGLMFNTHYFAEIAHQQLGENEYRDIVYDSPGLDSHQGSAKESRDGTVFRLGRMIPLDDTMAFSAHLGVGHITTETSWTERRTDNGVTTQTKGRETTTNTPALIGVGVHVRQTEHLDVRLRFEYMTELSSPLDHRYSLGTLSAGLTYRF